jgi:hypothetical protein
MSYEVPGRQETLIAAADLSAKQYQLVVVDTAGKAALAGAGGEVFGVIQNKPGNTQAATVMVTGISKVLCGGTITAGDLVASDANAKAVSSGGQVAASSQFGIALESGVANDLIAVELFHFGQRPQSVLQFHYNLADIAAGDILVAYVPGFAGKILKTSAVVSKPATTGGKAATITPKITGVAVTGGVLSLTSANMTPIGAVVNGTAITGANSFGAADSITLTASAVTAFVEGEIDILIVVG